MDWIFEMFLGHIFLVRFSDRYFKRCFERFENVFSGFSYDLKIYNFDFFKWLISICCLISSRSIEQNCLIFLNNLLLFNLVFVSLSPWIVSIFLAILEKSLPKNYEILEPTLLYIFSRLLCPFWAAAGEKTTFFFIPSQKVSNEYLFLPTIKYTSTNGRIENISIFSLVRYGTLTFALRSYPKP